MAPSDAEQACFEAGIKFGSMYHQFAGTPVSPESAASLERAIEQAIQNQPYCSDVTVHILTDHLDVTHGYTELSGRHMEVTIEVVYGGILVRASMSLDNGYPRMRIDEISDQTDG